MLSIEIVDRAFNKFHYLEFKNRAKKVKVIALYVSFWSSMWGHHLQLLKLISRWIQPSSIEPPQLPHFILILSGQRYDS